MRYKNIMVVQATTPPLALNLFLSALLFLFEIQNICFVLGIDSYSVVLAYNFVLKPIKLLACYKAELIICLSNCF